jgi:hypothetical protein
MRRIERAQCNNTHLKPSRDTARDLPEPVRPTRGTAQPLAQNPTATAFPSQDKRGRGDVHPTSVKTRYYRTRLVFANDFNRYQQVYLYHN